jgi:hypothetical protein
MNRRVPRWIFTYVVKPLFLALAFILKPIGLLLGLLNKPLARLEEKKLQCDIAEAMPFLFEERHGRIVPNEEVSVPPAFDYAFVKVEVEGMFISFCRGRGELEIYVGCIPQARGLRELGFVLSVLDEQRVYQRQAIANLGQAAEAIKANMDILLRAFGNNMDEELARRFGWNAVNERIANSESEREANKGLRSSRE